MPPVVVAKNEPLEFWHWEPGTKLVRGTWRIPVPAERLVEQPEEQSRLGEKLDQALKGTFPASDPFSLR